MTNFSTTDMYLAAFIWSQPGVDFKRLQPSTTDTKQGVFKFCFELEMSDSDLKSLLLDYQNDRSRVEPNAFMRKVGYLRDQIRFSCNR